MVMVMVVVMMMMMMMVMMIHTSHVTRHTSHVTRCREGHLHRVSLTSEGIGDVFLHVTRNTSRDT